ncbi:transferase [Streptomyces sp. JW3]|uniref:transferase n=1 Tax=Streptomyces sp. JW3 TaxID=3456955 RepID=UPI003FA47A47
MTATTTDQGPQPRLGCTTEADGRITFGLRLAPGTRDPRLLLRLRPRKGQPERVRHSLALEAAGDGHHTAVLPTGTALAEGRWDVYLTDGPDGERRRLRPGLRDLRALVDGHTRDRSAPVAVRIPYVTKDGFLAIRTWLRDAHAEAGSLTVADGALRVAARLHGAEFGAGAAVRLRLRGTGTERSLAPRVADDRRDFTFTVGLAELGAGPGKRVWEVYVWPAATAPPVRVARLLDDIADRADIHVQPAVPVGGTVVRPYYTAGNDLAVAVTPAG